jgi:hypothetical protein
MATETKPPAPAVGQTGRPRASVLITITGEEVHNMLWFLGAVLIVFWAIALAMKVTVGVIHLALVAGIILLVIGFFRGRNTTVTP